MAATKRVRRLRNRKVKARGWVQSWMLKLRASAMGRMARTTRPQPSAAPRLHSRVAVGRRGRPRTWRRGSRRLVRVCRTEKPSASKKRRKMEVRSGRMGSMWKRMARPRAARPATVSAARNQKTEVRKRASCRARSERRDVVGSSACNGGDSEVVLGYWIIRAGRGTETKCGILHYVQDDGLKKRVQTGPQKQKRLFLLDGCIELGDVAELGVALLEHDVEWERTEFREVVAKLFADHGHACFGIVLGSSARFEEDVIDAA